MENNRGDNEAARRDIGSMLRQKGNFRFRLTFEGACLDEECGGGAETNNRR
jgi:hypothetical protein